MRVAVTGATGNVGTAILKALHETPEITSVVAITRRMPDLDVSPYSGCEWISIDIAAASSEDSAVQRLSAAFSEVDAVIHLAWLIQPNSDRNLLRRVNVEGTRRVTAAVAAAGVRHLVVASSVGAYAPDETHDHRDETWPRTGIRTSHYSVDKAAQEEVLNSFSDGHPEVAVTRLRPALTFGAEAASEIQRYFLGRWMPLQLLRFGRMPILPIPKAFRGIQAVHAADVAQAYVASVLHQSPGAFNICADDVLGAGELADLIDHGRYVKLPTGLFRTALGLGYRAKLVAADAGWLDMGLAVPLMDNSRAKRELGWRPRYSAVEAMQELLEGMGQGTGAASIPLRPRDLDQPRPTQVGSEKWPPGESTAEYDALNGEPEDLDKDLLGLYLSDHLTGATAGSKRIERMAEAFADTPVYAALAELADQIRLERAFMKRLLEHLDIRRRPIAEAASWAMERIGRLKSNGAIFERSPMTLLLETELMRSAVIGKLGMWQCLDVNAQLLGVDAAQFSELTDSARHQLTVLEAVHDYARSSAFRHDRETFDTDSGLSPVRPE